MIDSQIDILAFGAHPDDVELACSGTLIGLAEKGYRTGVIALTQGELGTRGTPAIRVQEFEAASKVMGLAVHKMLDLPDGQIEVTEENRQKVIREIRAHRPSLVLAPYWQVRHPDHGYASNLVRESAFLAGLKKIDTGQEAFRPNKVLFYPGRFEFQPSFIVDISDHHARKIKAIQAYKSQFHNPDKGQFGTEATNISSPEFLEAIITRDKMYGSYVGVRYGEPFLAREPLRLDDPVAFFGPEYLNGFQ